jgi:tetratricopeptide (TPR) repeat protein
LAERGASYAARAELIQALKSVVQTLDAEEGGQTHSRAMEAGLTALREAADFTARGQTSTVSVDVAHVVIGHRTPILKHVPAAQLTPAGALQTYYQYATDQLALAGGHEPVASRALYGLGRLEANPANSNSKTVAGANAMALHQAALTVDPRNYQAANELAVLEARYGRLEDAKDLLLHSVDVSPSAEAWYNLSVVYERMGNPQAAKAARGWYEVLAAQNGLPAASGAAPSGSVYWIDAKTFADHSRTPETEALVARGPAPNVTGRDAPDSTVKDDPLSRWLGLKRKDSTARAATTTSASP